MRSRCRTALAGLAIGALLAGPLGCSIWEEIDGADKKMDEVRSGGAKPVPEKPAEDGGATPARKGEKGMLDKALAWSKKASTPPPKPHDPNDPIVTCKTKTGMSFVYKLDCLSQGGTVMGSAGK